MTNHHNSLTEAQQERLVLVQEECSEVIQNICKVLRYGYNTTHPFTGETTQAAIIREIKDLYHCLDRLRKDLNLIPYSEIINTYDKNKEKYLYHQND